MKNKILVPLFFLAFLVWFFYFLLRPDFFSSEDAAIYADIARNIVSGKGAVSNSLYPFFLDKIPPSSGPWPSLYPHFYPLVLSLGFLIFGISQVSSAATNGVFFLATLSFLFLLAKRLFNQKVAILSSLWYIFNPSLLGFSTSGMTESLFIFLTVASFYFLFLENSQPFLTGFLIGLSYLTRFQGILFLLITLGVLLLQKKTRGREIIYLLIGFFLPVIIYKLLLPPTVLDYGGFKESFIWSIISTGAIIPQAGVSSILKPPALDALPANLALVFKKIVFNFYYFLQGFLTATIPTIVVLYILNFFLPTSKKASQFRILILSLLITFAFFHFITLFEFRYLQTLLPFIIILSSATFLAFLEKFTPKKLAQYAAIFTFLFIILPLFTSSGSGTAIKRAFAHPRKTTILYLLAKIVKENTSSEAITVTDKAAHIAWYGNRKTILLPLNPEDLAKIDKKIPVDALFISNYYPEHFPLWQNLVENPRDFGNFYFAKSFIIKPEENYYRIPVKAVLYLKKKTPFSPK